MMNAFRVLASEVSSVDLKCPDLVDCINSVEFFPGPSIIIYVHMLPNALYRHTSDAYDDGFNAFVKLTSMPATAFKRMDQEELVKHSINTRFNKPIHSD